MPDSDLAIEVDRPYVKANNRTTVHAELTIDPGRQQEPANKNIIVCIDISGSMAGSAFDAAQTGSAQMLGLLEDGDRLGIVAFDTTAEVVMPLRRWGECDMASVRSRIDSIQTGGGTDIYGALEQCHTLLTGVDTGHRTATRVLLLSDGQDNDRDAPEFEQLAKDLGSQGISVMSAGIGSAYDQDTIRTIGERSQGQWKHISTAHEVRNFFGNQTVSAESTVVSNPQCRLTLEDGVELSEALRRLPQVQPVDVKRDDRHLIIPLPDLLAKEQQQIGLELEVPAKPPGEVTVASVHIGADGRSARADIDLTYTTDSEEVLAARNRDIWLKYMESVVRSNLRTTNIEDMETAQEGVNLMKQVDPESDTLQRAETALVQAQEADSDEERKRVRENTTYVSEE